MLPDYLGKTVSAFVLFLAGAVAIVSAQEGFPLDGTWRGEWGPSNDDATHVVIVMQWDGQNINGVINPGRNSINFKTAQLFPETWTINIEAEDPDGVQIHIEGQLDNIGSYNRTIKGTWIHGGNTYNLKITRQ